MSARSVEINTVPVRNVYPTSIAQSLGVQGSAGTVYGGPQGGPMQADNNSSSGSSTVDYAVAVGLTGRPLNWWITMFVMLVLLMWGSRKLGTGDGDFSNIKLSAYNVLTIGLASIVGISFFKMLFNKVPVPGLTTLINAV